MNRTYPGALISGRGGFTLIELLVVVSIISILSAIAVPNFLDAQTRAKVARTKADMRTLATAVECYHVDRNQYPVRHNSNILYTPTLPEVAVGSVPTRLKQMSAITTPVAYLSLLPVDVFERHLPGPNNVIDYWDPIQVSWFINTNNPFRPQFWVGPNDLGWMTVSVGPDGVIGQLNSGDQYGWPWAGKPLKGSMNNCYDPTNGTISAGNIYYSGVLGMDKTPAFITTHVPQIYY